MEPPHLTWTFFWFCFCAGMEVSHAECRGCNDSIALILTTKTATFSSDPTCNMTEGNNSGIGSINDLTPGTTYVINLTCLDCCVNVTTKPGEIPGLTLGAATTSSISLVWNKPEGVVSSYRVRLLGADTKMVKDTSGVIDDLTAGAEYDIKVSAVAEDNVTEGAMSNISVYTMPDQVQNLTVREVTTSSILVDWDEPDGDSLFYKVELGGNVQNTSETSINITGLSAGVSYDIIVTAVAGDRQTMGAGKEVLQYTKPGMIHNPSVTFTTTSINMSWSPPAGQELNYRLTWRNDGKQLIRYTTVESAVFTHLTPGTEYTIKLVAIAGDNRTEGDSFTLIQFTKPEEVTDIIVISGTTDISVTWTPASGGVDSYTVFLKRESLLRNTSHIANTTGAVFEGLTPGVLYCVEVVTETAHLSSSSPSVCNATVPKPPGSITVESQTVDSVNFTWSDPDDMDHNQYNFSVSSFKGSVITRNNWFMLDELQPGTPYNISVVTVGLLEYQSTAVTLTSFTRPEKPANVTVTAGTDTLNISWVLPAGRVDHYVLDVSNEELMYLDSRNTTLAYAHVAGLHPGRLHRITVTSVAGDLSNPSDVYSSATVPTPPASVHISERTNSSLHLEWASPRMMQDAPSVSYFITYKSSSGERQTNTSSNSTVLSELASGTLYNITVQTVGPQNSKSAIVDESSFTLPNPVSNLVACPSNTTAIKAEWSDPQGAQMFYTYLVKTYTSTGTLKMETRDHQVYFNGLEPGTRYRITVETVAAPTSQSGPEETYTFTEPQDVTDVTLIGGTTDMVVSWRLASGRVDSYSVLLKRGTALEHTSRDLSNTTADTTFDGLTPGVLFCVTVVTKSAHLETSSQSVCNATLPNPPGPITVDSQTVSSINFTWTDPDNMNHSQYNFSVSTIRGTVITQNNWFVLDYLQAGTLYSVSVATVGLLAYESTVVTAENYTRPESVSLIGVIGTTTNMSVIWTLASGGVDSYSVLLKRDTQLVENITDLSNTTGHALFEGLTPGVLYCVVVLTTRAYMESVSSSVCNATFPNPPGPIVLELQTEDSLNFTWSNPNDMAQDQYNFSVSTFKSSLITGNNWLLMDNLQPGTLYSISVKTLGALEYESIIVTAQNYTIPQAVNPSISSEGSNSSVRVSWNTPSGRVDYYSVKLNGLWTDLEAKRVNNDTNTLLFESLPAGMSYRAVVITHSGPVRTSSDLVTNATFPNPPGPIEILSKTTGSLELQWTKPLLMENASFYYKLSIYPPHSPGPALTPGTNYTFSSLVPGTPYNITVATVGAMELESEPVTIISVTTRPNSVKSPSFTTDEDNITVTWDQPDEYRWSYRYILTWQSPDQFLNASIRVTETEYTIYDLLPGSNYIISVTTETMDGTRGRPKLIDTCTDASPVNNVTISSPNTPNAKIIVTWTKPRGRHREVKIFIPKENINQSLSACSQNCSFTISNLRHYTQYNLIMETIGCGKPSRPLYFNPTTGITEPAIPENFKLLALARNLLYNKFSVEINSTLLVSNHGPITHVGVLITDNPADFNSSDIRTCLGKTYKDWSDKKTSTYLATVKERQETAPNRTSDMVIEVGDTSDWNGYHNGFLCGSGKYHFAIVLFTSLSLEGDLVDVQSSLVSITSFYPEVNLPTGPAYLGYAVGVPLGIFCILFIVLIGFIIYSRRSAKKASSDIQIHSLGAKISCAVKVEDFEAYYNKQKADSDCGFAEEFEDLKVVGTSQQKINALSVENKPKNRYNNVLPYDSSRVKLSIISGSSFDDYINADYMPGFNSRKEFIAAQGPLPGTVNDFWRMIWEKNVQTVVMLTRCVEQGKVKCEQYWTEVTKLYANIAVTQTSKVPLDDWTIREFDIKNVKTAETRTIRHFHFTAWPDHGVPESTELLISFRHLVREYMDQYSKHSPAVVHCSAGVGRTGTFIAIDRLVYQIERENVVDIYGIVHDMRLHRPLMVQTEAQYVFLYQCALDVIKSRTGTNVDLIYQNADAFSIYANIGLKRLK